MNVDNNLDQVRMDDINTATFLTSSEGEAGEEVSGEANFRMDDINTAITSSDGAGEEVSGEFEGVSGEFDFFPGTTRPADASDHASPLPAVSPGTPASPTVAATPAFPTSALPPEPPAPPAHTTSSPLTGTVRTSLASPCPSLIPETSVVVLEQEQSSVRAAFGSPPRKAQDLAEVSAAKSAGSLWVSAATSQDSVGAKEETEIGRKRSKEKLTTTTMTTHDPSLSTDHTRSVGEAVDGPSVPSWTSSGATVSITETKERGSSGVDGSGRHGGSGRSGVSSSSSSSGGRGPTTSSKGAGKGKAKRSEFWLGGIMFEKRRMLGEGAFGVVYEVSRSSRGREFSSGIVERRSSGLETNLSGFVQTPRNGAEPVGNVFGEERQEVSSKDDAERTSVKNGSKGISSRSSQEYQQRTPVGRGCRRPDDEVLIPLWLPGVNDVDQKSSSPSGSRTSSNSPSGSRTSSNVLPAGYSTTNGRVDHDHASHSDNFACKFVPLYQAGSQRMLREEVRLLGVFSARNHFAPSSARNGNQRDASARNHVVQCYCAEITHNGREARLLLELAHGDLRDYLERRVAMGR